MNKPKSFHRLPGIYFSKLPDTYEDQKLYVRVSTSQNPPTITYHKSTSEKDYSYIALLNLSDEDLTHLALLGIKVFIDDDNTFKKIFFNGSHTIAVEIDGGRSLYGY